MPQRKSRVEKDVRRTDRGVPFFAGSHNPNVAMLRRILLTYSIYNFDLSYCQARAGGFRHPVPGWHPLQPCCGASTDGDTGGIGLSTLSPG